jgi:hypothetical protein
VLVLSALDADGRLIGSACTETELGAGAGLCFDLTLEASPDLSTPPLVCDGGPCACTTSPDSCPTGYYCATDGKCAPGCKNTLDCPAQTPRCDLAQHRCVECLGPGDCPMGKRCSPGGTCVDGCDPGAGSTCPGAIACCNMLCVDTTQEISSCGACGRACASANVAAAACSANVCTSSCLSGWGNCNKPIAPAADDGCETNFNDVAHCGSCTNVCNLANATAECPSGSCRVKTCNANRFNCNGQHPDGCECAGTDKGDGMMGCCAGGTCQRSHITGLGQTFTSCHPSGVYTLSLAQAAGRAWFAGADGVGFANSCTDNGQTSMVYCVPQTAAATCACWAYAGTAVGYVRQNTSSATCLCPTTLHQQYN